jgi:hypothetical protein
MVEGMKTIETAVITKANTDKTVKEAVRVVEPHR